MKIMQYNILNGCREPERFEKFDRWMSKQSYDVVGFNEMNKWSTVDLEQRAAGWGYSHAFVFETKVSRHFVAVISKHPIEVIEAIEQPFHHALLHVKINDVHFLITHLSPKSAALREKEAEYIAHKVSGMDVPLLLMGDLNTLSPLDAAYYRDMNLLDALEHDESLKNKFVDQGAINYRPMNLLLEGGLHDSGCTQTFEHSVPTLINADKMHAAKMRLDYVLVNKQLLAHRPVARIIHNEEVDQLSDHYPIECEWE